jgi:hypothetical protein
MPSRDETAAYRAALAAAGRVSATAFGPEARRRAELRRPIYRSLPSADAMARGFVNGEIVQTPGELLVAGVERDLGVIVSEVEARKIEELRNAAEE